MWHIDDMTRVTHVVHKPLSDINEIPKAAWGPMGKATETTRLSSEGRWLCHTLGGSNPRRFLVNLSLAEVFVLSACGGDSLCPREVYVPRE
jgi:hypothetical protein